MSGHVYTATIAWSRDEGADFRSNRYSRRHLWSFDGGIEVPASSSPQVVPVPMSAPDAVDPEEAFVAALSSCHMLWFLSLAAKRRFVVEAYTDQPEGVMETNADGKVAMTRITLRPRVRFASSGEPDDATHIALHHEAHEACFLASSVRTEITCEPTLSRR